MVSIPTTPETIAGVDTYINAAHPAWRASRVNRPMLEAALALIGMRVLPPPILHGAYSVDTQAVSQHLKTFRQRLLSYPDWPELAPLDPSAAWMVATKDRRIEPEAP